MAIHVQVFPQCDFCDETYPDSINPLIITQELALADMLRAGWKLDNEMHKCPECVRKENKAVKGE